MSTIDRYLIRQSIAPFFLALGVFTFVLAVEPMLNYAKDLLAKGVSLPTVGLLIACLLPQALAITIPMALVTGVLMALGRLSADREAVALLACGVSPMRLLRPILVIGLLVGGLDMYTLVRLTPDANQLWRDIAFRELTEQTAADIKPRVFFKQFPGKVLYVTDVRPDGQWSRVLLGGTSESGKLQLTLAESGRLIIDKDQQQVVLLLDPARQYAPVGDGSAYASSQNQQVVVGIRADAVFGPRQTVATKNEMRPDQLREEIAKKRSIGEPVHQEIIQLQQMVSFPVACLVLAIVGLGLGLTAGRQGRLSGLTMGLGVIVVYYAFMAMAEAYTKSIARTGGPVDLVATLARWVPNIVLALIGAFALWRQTRPSGLNLPGLSWPWRRVKPEPPLPEGQSRPTKAVGRPIILASRRRLRLPGPRILDRYVSRSFVRSVTLAFLALLSLYYIGGFLDLADRIRRPGDGWVFINFLVQSTPQFVVFIIPIAILVAGLGTIGGLTRTGELTVMRACGVSLYRTALPLLLFALVGSGLLFLLEDRVLGEANKTASQLRDHFRDHQNPPPINVAGEGWLIGSAGRVYHYAAFDPSSPSASGQPTLVGLSVFTIDDQPYRLRRHLYANHATFAGGQWTADAGWVEVLDGEAQRHETFGRQPVDVDPVQDFMRAQQDPSTMRFGELREYVQKLGESGFNAAEPAVDLHRKLAFPAVTLVMTLLAVPFGVSIGRKGALYGIGLAIILAGAYFLTTTIFVALGSAGLLPPMLAAWGANIVFGAAALFMLLTVRT